MAGIFEGITVLDFTNNLAGPNTTAMLADFGAEVIKIERPVFGDDFRHIAPQIEGQAIFGMWSNRSKKSVVIDLTDPEGLELVKKMIETADVMVESFKPGTMKLLGLDYETAAAINPKIIYASVSLGGQFGGYSDKPGYDLIAQAKSGHMDLTGDPSGPPTRLGVPISDYVGSFNTFGAIASALFYRERTGIGQRIDVSLLDVMVAMNSTLEGAANMHTHPTRSGLHYQNFCPYGTFWGKNGQSCVIAAFGRAVWERLCKAIGKPELIDDPRSRGNVERTTNLEFVVSTIEGWLAEFDDIEDAIKVLEAADVPCSKIKSTDEVTEDEVLWDRGTLIHMETPPSIKSQKEIVTRGSWIKMSETPAVITRSPDLGEHNVEILTRYGLSADKINEMETRWGAGRAM